LWGGIVGYPRDDENFWYVISCARRLDTAHRQLERVREGLDLIAEARARGRSKADWIDDRIAILGDVELAMVALFRALDQGARLENSLDVKLRHPFPKRLSDRLGAIKELRNAYEHIDHRALGKLSRQAPTGNRRAHAAFSHAGEELEVTRTIRYRRWSLGIDAPATGLCVALRRWLRLTWLEICREG
jgi:hypothetical protein